MRGSTEARPSGILALDLDVGEPVVTDVYGAEEDQAELDREASEDRPHAEAVSAQNDGNARAVHVHIHRSR